MNITKVESFDDIHESGDYLLTENYLTKEVNGIAMKCVCGDIISLSNTVHTFNSYDPLDVHPSILHKRDDKSLPDCHYFIRQGKYIQA